MRVGGQSPGKTRYPLYRRLGGPPGAVGMGVGNLVLTGIRSTDRPARSESLYRLCYPVPLCQITGHKNPEDDKRPYIYSCVVQTNANFNL